MADWGESRVGRQVGNYRLTRLLGRGGFAEVYLGEHVFLQTQAALKLLRTHLAQDEQQSFIHEARTIAHLVHPNIVRVLDFGMQDDTPFLVMDYAPNGSLRERHPQGIRLAPSMILSYAQQVGSALQYAHEQKLIHRDVKPENMLIGRNGEVLLSDFGISVVAQSSQSQNTQEVIGSVPYMAPEQIQGKARPASDQYALAVAVYEWICGHRPFMGSMTELFSQHLFIAPPPLRQSAPEVSPAVEQVVMTALAKDPHARFGSLRAFVNALEQAYGQGRVVGDIAAHAATTRPDTMHQQQTVVATPPALSHTLVTGPNQQALTPPPPPGIYSGAVAHKIQPPSPRRFPRRAFLAGAAGLVVLAGGSTAAWYALAHRLPEKGTLIATYKGHADVVNRVAWHDDLLASASDDKTVQVWEANTGKNITVYREHNQEVKTLTWSPDGSRVASGATDYQVHIWDAKTGNRSGTFTKHAKKPYGDGIQALAWSPDGTYLASGSDDGLVYVWEANNPDKLRYIYRGHIEGNSYGATISSILWSRDSQRIASGDDNGKVLIWDALTGAHSFANEKVYGPKRAQAWSNDNQRIASGSYQKIQIWSVLAGAEIRTYEGHKQNVAGISWTSDDKYIASASEDGIVLVWDAATGATITSYAKLAKPVNSVAWAADNRRLAFGGDEQTVLIWVAL